ncbi:MAG: response regulator transcription factor [Moorea sp. SIO3G5]|nr:response regulator transcription factor [Moorena sp. SIO3G5]
MIIKKPMNPPVFLVVDDHLEVAENNTLYLKSLEKSARCVIAETPKKAFEILDWHTPDLIVVDLHFSTITGDLSAKPGLNLLQNIFQNYPSLNVLVYTENPTPLVNLNGITSHKGGFTVAKKNKPRQDFVEHAISALKGELHLPNELLQKLNDKKLWDEPKIQLLQLACQECLSDWAIAQRTHKCENSVRNCFKQIRKLMGIEALHEYIPEKKKVNNERVAMCMEAHRRNLI